MSCSKPLPPFVCDSLYYLNRNQLERFSIVCRPLKNFIERYLHSKPYRVFDILYIRRALYALVNNEVQWHPNRDGYSAQQFLAGETLHSCIKYYSLAEMRPYLDQNVRIKKTLIYLDGFSYLPEHIEEMESIAHLWCDGKIIIWNGSTGIVAENFQLILDSPKIMQCRHLYMTRAQFSFKDYKLLYNAKIIENHYYNDKTDPNYWPQFLEQTGMKPLVVLRGLHRESINTLLDHLCKKQKWSAGLGFPESPGQGLSIAPRSPRTEWGAARYAQIQPNVLRASRSKSGRPDLVFLKAQAKGYPLPPRLPRTEWGAARYAQIQPNDRRASRSKSGRPDLVFLKAQAKGYPSPPRSPRTE
ncbi:hypothetical protein Ddc_16944 [Ditylenchus destructor]|nr:hypothetical protein Ddc_16944 [Ditylenchus destructor]